jgi:hypothetical protein
VYSITPIPGLLVDLDLIAQDLVTLATMSLPMIARPDGLTFRSDLIVMSLSRIRSM